MSESCFWKDCVQMTHAHPSTSVCFRVCVFAQSAVCLCGYGSVTSAFAASVRLDLLWSSIAAFTPTVTEKQTGRQIKVGDRWREAGTTDTLGKRDKSFTQWVRRVHMVQRKRIKEENNNILSSHGRKNISPFSWRRRWWSRGGLFR